MMSKLLSRLVLASFAALVSALLMTPSTIASTPASLGETAVLSWLDSRLIRGRVLASDTGEPLAGAFVWLKVEGCPVQTDDLGAFQLLVFGFSREPTLQATAPGYVPTEGKPRLDGEGPFVLDLTLRPASEIHGRVVDEEGFPLASVAVWWRRVWLGIGFFGAYGAVDPWTTAQKDHRVVHSAADGSFVIRGLERGREWDLRAEVKGYATSQVHVVTSKTREVVEIVLDAGTELIGQVVGDEGEPIEGASLSLRERSPSGMSLLDPEDPAESPPRWEGSTAQNGRFSIPHLPPGFFVLTVDGRGYAPRWLDGLAIAKNTEVLDLGKVALQPGPKIRGWVMTDEGRPIAKAEVEVAPVNGDSRLVDEVSKEGRRQVQTDSRGAFQFDNLSPASPYSLTAKASGRATVRLKEVQPWLDEPASPLELVLEPAARLHGEVVDPQGHLVAGVEVQLLRVWSEGDLKHREEVDSVETDAQGRFAFEDLPAGLFLLRSPLPHTGRRTSEAPVDLPVGGEVGPVRVERVAEAKVQGHVLTPEGRPAVSAQVKLEETEELFFEVFVQTDSTGRFYQDGLPADEIHVTAVHPVHGRVERTLELGTGANEISLTLEDTARVEGRVVDVTTGEPIPRATVGLEPLDEWDTDTTGTDGLGRFSFRPATPDSYRLWARAEGFQETTLPKVLELDRDAEEHVLVRLQPGVAITGRLLGLAPSELGNVSLEGYPQHEHPSSHYGRVTPDGHYRLTDLHPGPWRVYARVENPVRKVSGEVTLEEGQREAWLDLDFGEGYTLTGRVFHNGEPLAGAPMTVSKWKSGGVTQRTDFEGVFRYGSLEPDQYFVRVTLPGGIEESRVIDLMSDQEVEVQVYTSRVAGRLVTSEGAPAADVEVTLNGAEPSSSRRYTVVTDAEGRFTFNTVVEGVYELHAYDPSQGRAEHTLKIAGLETHLGDVVLERGQPVVLQIRTHGGPGAFEGNGFVLDRNGQIIASYKTRIGEDGLASVIRVPAEGRELSLRVAGYGLVKIPLGGGRPLPYPVDLVPSATIELRRLGSGVGSVWVEDVAGRWSRFEIMHLLGHYYYFAGDATIPGLPPGRWLIMFSSQTREVELESGETVEVVFQ